MAKRKKEGHISFWVDQEFKEALKGYADAEGRTLSNMVVRILEKWYKENLAVKKMSQNSR